MARSEDYLTIRDADITYLNFKGEQRQFNAEGDRNFSIKLSEENAEAMMRDGWAVKQRLSKEGELMFHHLPVKVSYKGRSEPILVMITRKGKTVLDEETAGLIDDVEIESVDLIIRAYNWSVQGKRGVKAYLNEIYVTLYESDLAREYDQIPDASQWRPMIEGTPDRLAIGSREDYDAMMEGGFKGEVVAIESREMNENTIDGEVVYDSHDDLIDI